MWVLLLEALGALCLLLFIVWWTMFSGRKRGEPPRPPPPAEGAEAERLGAPRPPQDGPGR